MGYQSKILGTGRAFPEKILTNFDLEKMVDTSNDWIIERTGISERRIMDRDKDEMPSDLSTKAAKNALEMAGLEPNDLDCIVVACSTPDHVMPNVSCMVQVKLGVTNQCPCYDIVEACSGFVYATAMADSLIKNGLFKNILVIGTDVLSPKIDYKDRNTCILFGDGSGAAIFSRVDESDESKFFSHTLRADGTGQDFIKLEMGGTKSPIREAEQIGAPGYYMTMMGKDTFKFAVKTLAENAEKLMTECNIAISDIDWLIPHQANLRILEAFAKRMDFPMDKVVVNLDKYANTSAATVPTAFDEAVRDGKVKRGQTVLFNAFGAGLTSGANLFRF